MNTLEKRAQIKSLEDVTSNKVNVTVWKNANKNKYQKKTVMSGERGGGGGQVRILYYKTLITGINQR